jgi:uncharacterized tellurite resistance protein B-like protein
MWDLLTDQEKNEVLIKILVNLSKVDHQVNELEYSYLIYICDRMGIDHEIIKNYMQQDFALNEILPSEEKERVKILYHLLFTVNADGVIMEEEEIMVYQLAFKLGFHEEMTRDFIALMRTYKLEDLPDSSMINILKKYNN